MTPSKQNLPDTVGLIHTVRLMHIWSQTDPLTQSLHSSNKMAASVLRRASGHGVPPLTKRPPATDMCGPRENRFSPVENTGCGVYNPRAVPLPRKLANTKWTKSYFCGRFVSFWFVWPFLIYSLIFFVCYFCRFVCVYMWVCVSCFVLLCF